MNSENMELLSIIVPVYNVAPFLKKCIDSILKQTYSNLDIILVDDGSSDHSGVICDCAAKQDARVHVLHKTNGGAASARNLGMQCAHGAWIGFVDGDDWIEPDFYEKLYNAAVSEGSDLAICGFRYVDDQDHVLKEFRLDSKQSSAHEIFGLFFSEKDILLVSPCNKLYSRKLLPFMNFPENRKFEDEFIVNELLLASNRIVQIDEIGYNYLQRPNSATHLVFQVTQLDQIEAYYQRCLFFRDKGMHEYVSRACERFSDFYIESKKQFIPQTEKERARVREIDTMAADILRHFESEMTKKTRLRLQYPVIYASMSKAKRLLTKNGCR